MLVVGLTGGIASGKTTVANLFAKHGIPIVDADVVAREVVEPGTPGLRQIVEAFGDEVVTEDGALDRRALREQVFSDPAARQRLEAILHPLIRRRIEERLAACQAPYALLVAPLLLETGLDAHADRILVVDVPEQLQVERVMHRDDSSEAQALAIVEAQIRRDERLRRADDIVDNTAPLDALEPRVEELHRHYLAIAAG